LPISAHWTEGHISAKELPPFANYAEIERHQRNIVKTSLIALLLLPFTAAAAQEELTVESLLKGSKIPLKREFPLSKKTKPCDDFHLYVCENAEKAFKLPSDRSAWYFSFADSAERILHMKKAYFKKLTKGLEPKLERTKNVKRVYQACMNVKAHTQEERDFVKKQLAEITAPKDPAEMRAFLNGRTWTPYGLFLGIFDIANQDNPKRNDVGLIPDGMTLPERSYYEDKKALADLHAMAEKFFKAIKADKAKERADAVIDFETKFAMIHPLPADMRKLFSDNTYVKRDELLKTYPNMGFDKVFEKIPKDTNVRNITKDSMAYVNTYLGESSLFNLQSLAMFYTIKDNMDDAYPEFYKVIHEFRRKHMGGPPKRAPRDERCTYAAMGALGKELDAELITVLFPNFDGAKVRDTAETIRQAVLAGLKRNTWLTDGARKDAISKIKDAPLRLMQPETEKDWNFLEIGELSDTLAIANSYALSIAGIAQMQKKIREERNRSEWFTGPLTVNAFYSAEDNQFFLPQGILQYPFFDAAQSKIENLGAMGMVVGHELGHAVDDEGSKYDSKGALRKWMTEKDIKAFNERGSKLIAQFEKAGHNGRLTLGENIGDNVGVNFAMEAAFPDKDKASVGDIKKFFQAFGRVWCGVVRPERRKVQLKTGHHAQPDARINEQVVHRDLFYKAYECKAGDRMYLPPEDRVQMW
jgi:putative endopeptidase